MGRHSKPNPLNAVLRQTHMYSRWANPSYVQQDKQHTSSKVITRPQPVEQPEDLHSQRYVQTVYATPKPQPVRQVPQKPAVRTDAWKRKRQSAASASASALKFASAPKPTSAPKSAPARRFEIFDFVTYKTIKCPNSRCRSECSKFHNILEKRRSHLQFSYTSVPCPNTFGRGGWKSPRKCEDGDACDYLHTEIEQLYHPDNYKMTRCPNHSPVKKKRCSAGGACPFAHNQFERRSEVADKKSPKPKKAKNRSSPPTKKKKHIPNQNNAGPIEGFSGEIEHKGELGTIGTLEQKIMLAEKENSRLQAMLKQQDAVLEGQEKELKRAGDVDKQIEELKDSLLELDSRQFRQRLLYQKYKKSLACQACWHGEKKVVFVQCGHVVCLLCEEDSQKCPVCNAFTERHVLYF